MTGCWQLGWMPMAEADNETGQTITTIDGNANYSGNTVNKTGGTVDGSIFGVYGVLSFNTVILTYPTSPFTITVNNNHVSLSDGATATGAVIGADITLPNGTGTGSHPGTYILSGNSVTISGTSHSGNGWIAGARIMSFANEKAAVNKVENNTVTISTTDDTTFSNYHLIAGGATGIATDSQANNNKVIITGGNFSNAGKNITGAYGCDRANGSDSITASGNSVEISGGIFGSQNISGAKRYFMTANNNSVTISGGTFSGTTNITGGAADLGDKIANGNTVTIKSGTFSGTTNIYGGQGTTTNNNTVNLFNTMTINNLVGGSGTTSTGNTLNVGATGIQATTISGFQNINFFLPANVASGDTLLTVNGAASDLRGVTFGVAALSGATLAKGDTVNLLYNANGLTTDATLNTTASVSAPSGWTTDSTYDLSISQKDANTIIATVDGASQKEDTDLTERMKSPVETRAAAVSLLNNGSDLLVSQGFSQAANAVAIDLAEKYKAAKDNTREGLKDVAKGHFVPYAAIGGFNMRVNSGSHVDNKGMGLNVGFVRELPNKQGKLLFGPVVEYGRGSYDSYLNDGTHGNGDSSYWGLGVMARQTNNDGLYYEGSVRGGNLKADYAGNLAADRRASYDSSSNYWAAHMGLGKVTELTHGNALDCYMKYFYSHTAGDNVTATITNTTTGASATDTMNFDSVDSHRLRIGARLTHKLDNKSSLYGGLAYQHEFGGEARATYSGIAAPSPSIKGGSGMLELGWQVKPGGPVKIDLGATGWVGKQRGFSAQLGAMWTF